jgi:hypothetical protein
VVDGQRTLGSLVNQRPSLDWTSSEMDGGCSNQLDLMVHGARLEGFRRPNEEPEWDTHLTYVREMVLRANRAPNSYLDAHLSRPRPSFMGSGEWLTSDKSAGVGTALPAPELPMPKYRRSHT